MFTGVNPTVASYQKGCGKFCYPNATNGYAEWSTGPTLAGNVACCIVKNLKWYDCNDWLFPENPSSDPASRPGSKDKETNNTRYPKSNKHRKRSSKIPPNTTGVFSDCGRNSFSRMKLIRLLIVSLCII